MISHRNSSKKSWNHLDVMVRWALFDNFASSKPPAGVWRRIEERVEKEQRTRHISVWRGFWKACKLVFGLLVGKGLARTSSYYLNPSEVLGTRYAGSCWLTYQYDLPVLLMSVF